MYKLAGLDAGFLYNETPRAPQHIASVQVLELPEGRGTTEYVADLKRLLVERAHLIPYFTNRLQYTPFRLDHPVWVRDPDFDIDNHVRLVEVDSPGSRAEFEAKIAELHARPLDRGKPLWEIWVLSGLEGGRIAFYNRVHHACLDGVSGQAAVESIMDLTPEVQAVEPPPAAFHTRPCAESPMDLLASAFENFARYQIRQTTRLFDHADTVRRVLQRSADPGKGLGAVGGMAPRTRFNRSVERARSYATAELPLRDLRSIGKATGTTMNDVVLAVSAGGLRTYLERVGELPERAMVAGCPVSLRKPGDTSASNQLTMMQVGLASDEADPVKRLLKIGRSSRQAKGFIADIAGSYDADVSLPGLPGLMSAAMQMFEAGNMADVLPPRLPFNLVVSNVPGPRKQLYCLGARVLTHYPVSIPTHSLGVNITVQSYLDQVYVGITACAQALPDPALLRNDLLESFVGLKERVLREPAVFTPRERAVRERLLPLGNRPGDEVSESQAA